jgi:hypothetical protein
VDTENSDRIENAGFRSVREIVIVSTMTPFFVALLALVASTFRTRALSRLRSLPSAIRSPSCNEARPVVSAFGNLTGCCGLGCPVSPRARYRPRSPVTVFVTVAVRIEATWC